MNGRTDITADNDVYDISYNKGERKEDCLGTRRMRGRQRAPFPHDKAKGTLKGRLNVASIVIHV